MILSHDYLLRIARDVFEALNTPPSEAEIMAESLVSANLMGMDSHGVIRIPQYTTDVREGRSVPGAPVTLLSETPTTAMVDGNWNFGQVAAQRATTIALEKARTGRVACVSLRRCRHVGCAGAYPRQAAERGFIGIAMCSAGKEGHWVCPWGGREGRLSTNPIAFAAPTGGNPLVMDFSTSSASEGKVRLMWNRGEPLPEDWIVDNQGRRSRDPKDLYGPPRGSILPFGGSQAYKGYGFALMAQILASVLGDPCWHEQPGGEPMANTLWLLVLDIAAFMPPDDFRREMDALVQHVKSSAPAEGFDEILVPGEPEYRTMEKRRRDGIPVEEETWHQIQDVAQELGVTL